MKELIIYALIIVLLLGLFTVPGLLMDQKVAVDAMQSAGYSNVQVTGRWAIFVSMAGCSREDSVKFDVTATNPKGAKIDNAYVCVGWPFKGATIRYR